MALHAQPPVTWRFTDDGIPTCPSLIGQPEMKDPLGLTWNPQYSSNGTISITWQFFDSRSAVMLVMSTDMSRAYWPPCMLVPPDVVLVGGCTGGGECRFT